MEIEQNLTIKYNALSHIGSKRQHNQDAYAEFQIPGGYGFAVCDGINGKEGGGAIASKMAIESIKRQFRNSQFKNPQKALTNALTLANFQLYDHVQKNERFKGMGTSCAIVLIIDQLVYYAYIGNVRVYFLRENTIYRLTKDHTQAQTALQQNKITAHQLESHPGYYTADRALGFDKDVNFSVCKQPIAIEEDDMVLITSDGLFKELTEEQIADILNDPDASVDYIADNLSRKADEAGGQDNITLAVAHAFNATKVPYTPDDQQPELVGKKKIPKIAWIIAGLVALIGILYGINELVFTHEKVAKPKEHKEEIVKDKKAEQTEKQAVKKQEKEPVENKAIEPQIIVHKIDKGDNFYRLGIKFNVTVQLLERINNIQSKSLRLGQKVKIPVKAIHHVAQGESLSVIAEKYQTPVNDILKANGLDNADKLAKGMKINIPFQYEEKIAE